MDSKKFFTRTITYTLLLLVLIAGFIILIDPFVRYHAPSFKLAAVETDERSSVIGLARNMDYDTALIGSSMSENFKDTWFEDNVLGNKCVKLPLQGAHMDDYEPVLKEALKHEGTKNIFFCLDTYLFIDDNNSYPCTIEDYYLATPGIKDVHYLFNKSVLFDYVPKFLVNNYREDYDDSNAYVWNDDYEYSKYAARAAYMSLRLLVKQEERAYDVYFDNADKVTDRLLSIINDNKDVNFYLYAPPYSILFWDDCILKGNATATICTLDREYERLLQCSNVRLFYFQNDYDTITDLNYYRDYSHYNQQVNLKMYRYMKAGDYELTQATCYDTLLSMYEYITTYNYEQCFH